METDWYGPPPVGRAGVADAVGIIGPGTAVLVKGSLVAGLGPVADELAG